MRLLNDYGYVDKNGLAWWVPQGTVVDGASIPQIFWSIIGGPWDGPYRNASVIHDWYCSTRSHPWQDVHRMFYEAMLANCTSRLKAVAMYAAVWARGPRWRHAVQSNTELSALMSGVGTQYQTFEYYGRIESLQAGADLPPGAPEMTPEDFQELIGGLDEQASLEQIESAVDAYAPSGRSEADRPPPVARDIDERETDPGLTRPF